MGYYSKEEIVNFVSENLQSIESKGLKSMTPEAEVLKRLNDEEDLVGFFWIDYDDSSGTGEKLKFEGKTWYRISHNLYTDDRFAIDLYQAMKSGVTVSDVILERQREQELAKQGIVDISAVEEKVRENITTKNKEDGVE
jgi:hypothetical protein